MVIPLRCATSSAHPVGCTAHTVQLIDFGMARRFTADEEVLAFG